ncbi:MAG TPA: hypothetical protein VGU68_14670 [Ktedonobacteraceae bacterium]|nr:hypothetical protein [Ktedonobacteraceae bacterium]
MRPSKKEGTLSGSLFSPLRGSHAFWCGWSVGDPGRPPTSHTKSLAKRQRR